MSLSRQLSECVTTKNCKIFNYDMITIRKREESFQNWPTDKVQTPSILSQCGFYYIGESDRVVCYYCGIGIRDWQPDDNPWMEHALYSARCAYLLLNKSKMNKPTAAVSRNFVSVS